MKFLSLLLLYLFLLPISNFSQWKEIETPKGRFLLNDIIKVNNTLIAFNNNAFYKSLDSGKSWEKIISKGLDSLYSINVVYTDNKDVYLLSYSNVNNEVGVFKSSDYCLTFNLISNDYFKDIKIFNNNFFLTSSILSITNNFLKYDTLYNNKSYFINGKIEVVNDLLIYYDKGAFSSNPQIINEGIVYSFDNGNSWVEWNNGLIKNFAIYNDVHFTDSSSFIATNKGLFKSEGLGKIWKKISVPSNNQDFKSIESVNSDLYISNSSNEIYKSKDQGLTWELILQSSNLKITNLKCIDKSIYIIGLGLYEIVEDRIVELPLFDNSSIIDFKIDKNIKYILTSYNGIYFSKKFNNWTELNDSLRINISVKNNLEVKDSIIITSYSANNILSISKDLGSSWIDTNIVNEDIVLESNIFNNIISVVSSNNLIYSLDKGNNWINYYEKNPDFNIRFRKIYQINEDTFLASTFNNGILISEDKFNSWNKITDSDETTLNYVTTYFILKNKNNLISPKHDFNDYTSEEFFISNDEGKTWRLKKFYNEKIYIYDMINYNENIFMTTSIGFMYSIDFGSNWELYNVGLDINGVDKVQNIPFRSLTLNNDTIYIALKDKLMKLPLLELGIEYNSVEITENRNYLFTYPPFPQPTKSEVKINTYWDSALPFTTEDIEIYNLSGVKINTTDKLRIIKETNYNGHIIWDTSNEEAGIYIVYIKHGTESRTRKVMVEK